ncbi:MAG: DUF1015 domain-containing protein [Candidatus Omnitrophota bacterium]|nr:DUF1015 domain-containing protein [Candidatus Omnitrophota bacterium]
MAEIKPFKAVLYNQDKVNGTAKVVCPPYDVINEKARENYANLSPYNMVRLILPTKNEAEQAGCESVYAFAKKQLDDWMEKEVLCHAKEEAIYLYEQEYVYLGEKKKRQGIIALLKMDDGGNSSKTKSRIHAHEHTHLGPKEDRLQLIRQVKANLSPVFVLFPDKNHIIRRITDKYVHSQPLIDVKADSVRHKLWRITDNKLINEVQRDLKTCDIFIADGHHRYEVACNFREEERKALGNPDRELDCDYLMTYLTDLNSRGLTIMPTHRLIKNVPPDLINGLPGELTKFFDLHRAKDRHDLFVMLGKAVKNECVLGMYQKEAGHKKEGKFYLLRLKSGINLDTVIDIDKPKEYKKLCVVILNYLILGKMLKIDVDLCNSDASTVKHISYTNDTELAVKMVDRSEAQLLFFLNPVNVEVLAHVAAQGERMPPKSTFFYPKLLTGLVINKFSEESGLA